MIVFASSLSAFSTNPESRCGRRPTVVRITRSHATSTGARAMGPGVGTVRACDFAAQPPKPKPSTPRPESLIAVLLFITVGAHRNTLIGTVGTDILRRP